MRDLAWDEVEGMPHLFLPDTVLRVGWHHVPYSYGTQSDRILQLLTPNGWERLLTVNYNPGNRVWVDDQERDAASLAAGLQCQRYAERIYADKIIRAMRG